MGAKLHNSARGGGCGSGDRHEAHCRTSAEGIYDTADLFDIDAWVAMLEEQKLRIARAAGVEPSKVSIQLGH